MPTVPPARAKASDVPRPDRARAAVGWKSAETLARLSKMIRSVEEQWHMRWRVKVGDDDRARSLAVARILRATRLALANKDDKKLVELATCSREYLDQQGNDFLARRTESAAGLRGLMQSWLKANHTPAGLAGVFIGVVWDRPSAIRSELAALGVSLRPRADRDAAVLRATKAFEKILRASTVSGVAARGQRLVLAEKLVVAGLRAMGYPERESGTLFAGG